MSVPDDPTDVAWLSAQLGRPVASVAVTDLSDAGGLSGSMRRVTIHFENPSDAPLSAILKTTAPGTEARSVELGLAREALFYAELGPELAAAADPVPLPAVYASVGDLASGRRAVLLEDLGRGVQLGHLFGAGSPLNWGKDLEALRKGVALTPAEATALAYSAAARLHARGWRRADLLARPYLRGVDLVQGGGRAAWDASQQFAVACWDAARGKGALADWDAHVVACVDAALAKAEWAAAQAEFQARPWTLVHGDYHPANLMLVAGRLVLLDFEVVGVGSGPQDLGQFAISHTAPALRAETERAAVAAYYAQLCELAPAAAAELSAEACWAEYVAGGVGRWMWLLPLLADMCPAPMARYFHDQVAAFIKDHSVDPANVPMPRV
jgi:hypothetical protein